MKSDGGHAFPQALGAGENSGAFMGCEGMSVRDYFAAKAMHAELVSSGSFDGPAEALARAAMENGQTVTERVAFLSYAMADAMLAQREKQS